MASDEPSGEASGEAFGGPSGEAPARDPETLELFIEESMEGLQRIERLLLEAEKGQPAPTMMATLFRDIHTIKGTSGFLALPKILSLSHTAEDLLSKLRDQTLAAHPVHFSHLMEVVDTLRRMIDTVKETNDEGELEVAALVGKLVADMAGRAEAAPTLKMAALSPNMPDSPKPIAAPPPRVDDRSRGDSGDGTVRVNVGVLDRLVNLMGELVLSRNQIIQMMRGISDRNTNVQAATQRLSLITSELQGQIMKTRMQPVGRVFEKIPRMVRDLATQLGKQVEVKIEGANTEIDKAIIEAIRDPVMHMVRNALDHGFETPTQRAQTGKSEIGTLTVRAAHQGGMVAIEIADDGRGMDPDALRKHALRKGIITPEEAAQISDRDALELIFRPGFSTAAQVSDVSGRGVGMDVVRTHVERAGGQVELDSVVGKGSSVLLKMPLTLAIVPALLIKTGAQRFAIPQTNLLELVRLMPEDAKTKIEQVRGASIYRLRGEILPLVFLRSLLQLEMPAPPPENNIFIVVISLGALHYGLVVDEVNDTEEIVIKPLVGQLKRIPCYSGATVLGDGGVALILEMNGIATMAGIDVGSTAAAKTVTTVRRSRSQQYVVFRLGPGDARAGRSEEANGAQCAVPLSMVARLEELPMSTLETVGGNEVVQYRNTIMPICRPEALLPLGTSKPDGNVQPLIVFDFGQRVALAVSSIIDVSEVTEDDSDMEASPFCVGRTVLFGRTTLLLDVYEIVRQLAPNFVRERRQREGRPRILLADNSSTMRTALATYLRGNGLEVVEVVGGQQALDALTQAKTPFDAIICDVEMQGIDGFQLLEAVSMTYANLPVFLWTYLQDEAIAERARQEGAKACINKLQREELLAALIEHGIAKRRRNSDLAPASVSS